MYVDNGTDTVITTAYNAGQWWTVDEDALFFVIDEDGNIENGSYGSVAVDDDDRAYFVIEDGMVTHMFIETVDTKNNAQPATVGITSNKSISSGVISATPDETVTLTADVTLADRNDRVTSYRWYSATTAQGDLDDVETNGKPIGTGESITVPTDTIGTTYYYVVVETYNDRVTGTDTAKNYAGVKVNVAEAAQTLNVAVYYTTNGHKNTTFETEVVTVDLEGGVLATVTEADLKNIPEGYTVTAGLPKIITAGETPEAIVTVDDAAGVKHVANDTDLNSALSDSTVNTIYLAAGEYTVSQTVNGDKTIYGENGAVIKSNSYGGENTGLFVNGTETLTVENVTFQGEGSRSRGIVTAGNAMTLNLKNCVFVGTDSGIWLNGCAGGTIENCDFSALTGNALNIDGLTRALTFENCTFSADNTYPDIACATETIADYVKVDGGSACRVKWYAPTEGDKTYGEYE